ncbi:MAG: hypothetical protein UW64_C0003G0048 [Microgenomates group bacterium GW2011_GWC1_44_37]|uniref:Membrane protein 6-pyruvoyl-tetrahydropterin synthase-related domain-containing protein n=1 Tax=Candidatus Collierbacteria bacterium GW2011_GWB2_44_22 TaxID=1618387 RepID=A0A0G1HZS1_9BACT|nr:MAG: hypothetical protein UW31_C0005G0047 [Candidatus Collierbacteria bacterium GW2011_GWA2_44_13]KKT51483.1 MAG: hypothetical protein UW42_C0002G0016 [Candidatus Collierbacteria bacterium GW2011_GWB1_44_197]KKT52495.1 MAG: hypothetical protein UW44_C0001G0047 [Candidatus Collierbacteria bacterium GW2011_GWB2_44_22]KKT62718.1 MAG: hypothetical protein UW56_C0004G0031 [Candidatus Collierbacteria bacterium GW2011_GWD1_44_27]KKT66496.1 MAG: hypothetical protein UW58_C0007G0016 [Candidatus Colli
MSLFLSLIPILSLFMATIRQNLPHGYVFAGGDFGTIINYPYILYQLGQLWQTFGEGNMSTLFSYYPYYWLLSLFESASGHNYGFLFNPIFIFMGGFISFFVFSREFLNKKNTLWSVTVSTLYALNAFTFIRALTPAPYISIYVFVPVIFLFTKQYFSSNRLLSRDLAKLAIIMFFANTAFGNAPFFVSLNILLFIFIILHHYVSQISTDLIFVIKMFVYYLSLFLITFVSIIPQIPTLFSMSQGFKAGTMSFDLAGWIYWQSLSLKDALFLSDSVLNITLLFSPWVLTGVLVIPVLFFLSQVVKNQKEKHEEDSTNILILTTMSLFVILLANKGRGIVSKEQTLFLFNNVILNSIRSIDKSLIYLPFFYLGTILISFKKISKRWLYFVLFTSTVPFLVVLSRNVYLYKVGLEDHKSYQESRFAYVIKIPQEYFFLADKLKEDKEDYKIMSMPWSVINSVGWVNYPKWKVVGSDPTIQLFEKPVVQMNNPSPFGIWSYGEDWNSEASSSGDWIVKLASILNVKYLLYHNDVAEVFYNSTIDKMHHMTEAGIVSLNQSNAYFNLYEIPRTGLFPHIYLPEQAVVTTREINEFPDILDSIKGAKTFSVIFTQQNKTKSTVINNISASPYQANSQISYSKISPTEYTISLVRVSSPVQVVFSETYNKNWYLYPNTKNGISRLYDTWFKKNLEDDNHFVVNGYANGWLLNPKELCSGEGVLCTTNPDGTLNLSLNIVFWPQRLLYLGELVSGTVFISSLIYLLCTKRSQTS